MADLRQRVRQDGADEAGRANDEDALVVQVVEVRNVLQGALTVGPGDVLEFRICHMLISLSMEEGL